ncbi:hypothetical protein BGX26_012056 [Mortierella sp. AD094]|nr:hypothetical protein BGX26_012056 [Mortierella sp. AD094]
MNLIGVRGISPCISRRVNSLRFFTRPLAVAPPVVSEPLVTPTKRRVFIKDFYVSPDESGMRLDRFLKHRIEQDRELPDVNNSLISKWLRKRQVKLLAPDDQQEINKLRDEISQDLSTSKAKTATSGAMRIEAGQAWRVRALMELVDDRNLESTRITEDSIESQQKNVLPLQDWIVYLDEKVIVLDKPAGVAVQARTRKAAQDLTKRFHDGTIEAVDLEDKKTIQKKYLAIVGSSQPIRYPKLETCMTTGGLLRLQGNMVAAVQGKRQSIRMQSDGNSVSMPSETGVVWTSTTDVRITSQNTKNETHFALLQLYPRTGRKHQLRVHCAQLLNAPILGDAKYNLEGTIEGRKPSRVYLHMAELTLKGWLQDGSKVAPREEGESGYTILEDGSLIRNKSPLRKLTIRCGIRDPDEFVWSQFLARCSYLEELTLGYYGSMDSMPFLNMGWLSSAIRNSFLGLQELNLRGSYWPDEQYALVIGACSGLLSIVVPGVASFGRLAVEALLRHAPNLERVAIDGSKQVTSKYVQLLLTRAPHLLEFVSMVTHESQFARSVHLNASFLVLWPNPWICMNLVILKLLGALIHLEELWLGPQYWIYGPIEDSDIDSDDDEDGSPGWSEGESNSEYVESEPGEDSDYEENVESEPGEDFEYEEYVPPVPGFQEDCLQLSLSTGLDLMINLKAMRILSIHSMAHCVRLPEVQWMCDQWPKLQATKGLFHSSSSLLSSAFLLSITWDTVEENQTKEWLQENRPGIRV